MVAKKMQQPISAFRKWLNNQFFRKVRISSGKLPFILLKSSCIWATRWTNSLCSAVCSDSIG